MLIVPITLGLDVKDVRPFTVYIVQDRSADLRPLDSGEWGYFDGWILECTRCYYRCVATGRFESLCPSCGLCALHCITEADKIIWCEG